MRTAIGWLLRKSRLVVVMTALEGRSGKEIPWGYGLAYRPNHLMIGYFMPIPLNLVVEGSIRLYWRVKWGFYPSMREQFYNEAYERGRQYQHTALIEELEKLKRARLSDRPIAGAKV